MSDLMIALISATPAAIAPAASAITDAFPGTAIWNLLDDRLLADAERDGGITDALEKRVDRLIESAIEGGADGVLLTCSQFGARADRRDVAVDGAAVLSADGPLFAEVVARRPSSVLVVASLASAAEDSGERLRSALLAEDVRASVRSIVVSGFSDPAIADPAGVLIDAVTSLDGPVDVIVLAQYSLAPLRDALAARVTAPVLDGPSAATRRFVGILGGADR